MSNDLTTRHSGCDSPPSPVPVLPSTPDSIVVDDSTTIHDDSEVEEVGEVMEELWSFFVSRAPSRRGATFDLRAFVKCHEESADVDFAVNDKPGSMQHDRPCGSLRWKGTETEDSEYTAGSYSSVSSKVEVLANGKLATPLQCRAMAPVAGGVGRHS